MLPSVATLLAVFWDGWLHSNSTTLDSFWSKAHMLAIALFGGGLGWHPTMWTGVLTTSMGVGYGIVSASEMK